MISLNLHGQPLAVIVFGVLCFLLLTAVLALWRVRWGTGWRDATWLGGLEAGIIGSLGGIWLLTLQSYYVGGMGQIDLLPFRVLFNSIPLGEFWVRLAMFDLAGNFALFFPLGCLVALRFRGLRLLQWAAVALAMSGSIEVVQFAVLNRSADITDVIMNGAGGVAGFWLARLAWQISQRRLGALT